MRFLQIIPIVLLLLAWPARALETAEEIRECSRRNYPEQTSVQTIRLTARDRAGGERSLDARLHWKRSSNSARIMIRVDAPPDLRDSAYLVIENRGRDDMFMYLPAMQKVRRVATGSMAGQLWGTDFSYEDMKQLQGIAQEGETTRLDDAEVGGRSTYVLALAPPAEEESSYERIVSYIDQRTCVALRVEFYERGERLRKRLVADPERVEEVGGKWVAHQLDMFDLHNETQTRLAIEKVVYDEKISSRSFDPGRFFLGR